MGCFNGGCMLTGLPIFSHEPMYAILLLDSSGLGRPNVPIHATDWCAPMMFPMLGQYNHYGMIEKPKEQWFHRAMLEHFNEIINSDTPRFGDTLQVAKWDNSKGKDVNHKLKKPYDTVEAFFEDVVREEILYRGQQLRLGFIRQDAYAAFQSFAKKQCRDKKHLSDTLEADADLYFEFIKEYDRRQKALDRNDSKALSAFYLEWRNYGWGDESNQLKFSGEYHNIFVRYLKYDKFFNHGLHEVGLWISDHASEVTDEQWTEFKKSACDFIRIAHTFDFLGKIWMPQSGRGQGWDLEEWIKAHAVQTRIVKALEKKVEKYCNS